MTELQKFLLAAVAGMLFFAGLVASYKFGQKSRVQGPSLPVNVKTDTLIVRDTIRVEKPVFKVKYVDRVQLVPVTDTITRHDTLYMALDIERREYAGDDYRAVVSGWHPSLDEIEVYPKTLYLQTEVTQSPQKRRTRAGVGIAAGPGVFWTPDAGIQFGAGAVVGLSVTF